MATRSGYSGFRACPYEANKSATPAAAEQEGKDVLNANNLLTNCSNVLIMFLAGLLTSPWRPPLSAPSNSDTGKLLDRIAAHGAASQNFSDAQPLLSSVSL
jgi:hypothetical protein